MTAVILADDYAIGYSSIAALADGVTAAVLAADDYAIGYAYAGWGLCAAAAVGYVVVLLQRGRRASSKVPEGRRRWSDTP